MTNAAPMNRESWLGALVEKFRPMISRVGYELPARVRVACGWPSDAGRAPIRKSIGQAFHPCVSSDGAHETFISPCLDDPVEVAHVLLHELVHHAVGTECGHRGPFRRLAVSLGLVGKMTATVPSDELRERLHALCEEIGPYPHAAITDEKRPRQKTRMLKVVCPGCACTIRMARYWIEKCGTPVCGCGVRMNEPERPSAESSTPKAQALSAGLEMERSEHVPRARRYRTAMRATQNNPPRAQGAQLDGELNQPRAQGSKT